MTKYRVVPIRTNFGHRYLQFQSTRKRRCWPWFWRTREEECWRFVPDRAIQKVLGYCLSEEHCPTKLSTWSGLENSFLESHFLSVYNHTEYPFNNFLLRYPDISLYFAEGREARQSYLREKAVVRPTEYL